jgi:hypothetical protein
MKSFMAIVANSNNKVDKYMDFDVEADAVAHTSEHGGFVVPSVGGGSEYWVVDAEAQTVVNDQAQADADALESSWANLRAERDSLLVSSDWTQYNDSPLTDEVKTSWATYRQSLRDLPETHASDPDAVVWPTPPE